ncbi:hypothetical protein [Acidianus bottle-shaped virus 3 strain ABV3]|uniref:Uncharacterized protein n=1 Tax=Acidianus bottle-shaped virus 3 strain ABV3 TaxID=1732174 RepID=A0A0N9NJM3_9VIRU|nr:hypothetical protein AVU00_gp55 [Acidianus bottle-shaped virus 3 strain ABV3]ALG96857.1 hypothetical protein [Acidianus bottle-shaped virus 3 strain ABV3]
MAFNGNFFTFSPVSLVIIAILSALGYKFTREISTNRAVPVIIGLIMIFLGKGGILSTVGAGITALGISRFIAQETEKIISS